MHEGLRVNLIYCPPCLNKPLETTSSGIDLRSSDTIISGEASEKASKYEFFPIGNKCDSMVACSCEWDLPRGYIKLLLKRQQRR